MIEAGHRLPRTFWILWAGTALNQLGNALVIPFLAVYLALRLHTGPAGVGLALALQGVAQVAASFLGGQLADRVGRKWTMVGSLFGAALATSALGLTRAALWAVLLLVARGLVLPLYGPASTAMVADIVPVKDAYGAFGLTRIGSNVGFMLGPALGAFLAGNGGAAGDRLLFLLSAGILALYAVVSFVFLRETRPRSGDADTASSRAIGSESREEEGAQRVPGVGEGAEAQPLVGVREHPLALRRLLGLPPMGVFLCALALLGVVYSQLYWVLPNYMVLRLGLLGAHFGYLASENALVIVALSVPVLRWTRRWEPAKSVWRGALLWAAGFALIAVCRSLTSLFVPVFMISIGEILVNPGAISYVAARARPERRGRMLSWVNVANRAGSALGPLAGGLALSRLGSWGPWLGAGAFGVVAALVVRLLAQREARDLGVGAGPLPGPVPSASGL